MQKGRIRRGAKVSHGNSYGYWPLCEPPGHEYYSGSYENVTKFPDAVFDMVWVTGVEQHYWECTRFGYGLVAECEHNGYGNGAVLVFGRENVELLDD